MSKLRIYIAIALGVLLAPQALCENYPIRGRVIDRLTRRGVAYAAVVIVGQGTKGASADAEGEFVIEGVAPGIYRLEASMLGYKTTVTPEYLVSAATPFIEIEMDEESQGVDAVTVRPTPFRRTVESPAACPSGRLLARKDSASRPQCQIYLKKRTAPLGAVRFCRIGSLSITSPRRSWRASSSDRKRSASRGRSWRPYLRPRR